MTIEAVFFDVDGTLVDSNDQHVLAWQQVFETEGHILERDLIHHQIGKGADMLVPALVPELAASARRLGEAEGEVFKTKFLESIKPFDGAQLLLRRVKDSGRKSVLASSASTAQLDHYLDLLGIRDLVVATISADEVVNTKPAGDIFAAALGKTSLLAHQVVVVGDTPYDVQSASRCNIATVALRSGKFGDEILMQAGAVKVYDDVAALLADFENSPLCQ